MKWFYRYLGKKIRHAQRDEDDCMPTLAGKAISVRENEDIASEPITFKMFKAKGGWAIEFRQYDRKTDRVETSLHVISGDEDLGDQVSKIITYESMLR